MPTPFQIGQNLAKTNKPLPSMNNVPTAIREQVKTGYGSGKKLSRPTHTGERQLLPLTASVARGFSMPLGLPHLPGASGRSTHQGERTKQSRRIALWLWLALLLALAHPCGSALAGEDQFSFSDLRHPKEAFLEKAFCSPNSPLTAELAKRLGSFTAANSKLAGPALAAQQRRYEIGMAMSLCQGGFRVAGTLYGKLSQRDKDARQKALDDAVNHESKDTTTYVLPDHPDVVATVGPATTSSENGKDCEVVPDSLAEASENESALNKFCRTPPDGAWQRQTAL